MWEGIGWNSNRDEKVRMPKVCQKLCKSFPFIWDGGIKLNLHNHFWDMNISTNFWSEPITLSDLNIFWLVASLAKRNELAYIFHRDSVARWAGRLTRHGYGCRTWRWACPVQIPPGWEAWLDQLTWWAGGGCPPFCRGKRHQSIHQMYVFTTTAVTKRFHSKIHQPLRQQLP